MLKGKQKARKVAKRVKAMENDQIESGGEESQQQDHPPAPDPAADTRPDPRNAPAMPSAPPVDRNLVLIAAAIMFTKPGPGTLKEAYQHATTKTHRRRPRRRFKRFGVG
jgi:hypothetical protein